jgi:arylsulfatase
MPAPNILIILNDDMGYSDLACYGGEIDTPNLDRLANNGLRFTQFSNTPRCTPSRASLLTGLHPHQCGIGVLTGSFGDGDYDGNLTQRCVTVAELLNDAGYRSYASGKWHLAADVKTPNDAWPTHRGFAHHYGILAGATTFYWPKTLMRDLENVEHEAQQDPDYFLTDAISDEAVGFLRRHLAEHPGKPFFQYLAYTAPHWPLHAKQADIAACKGRFDAGWDVLRAKRRERMIAMGLIDSQWKLTARDPAVPAWDKLDDERQRWEARRMEVYAAQITCMDRGIGRVIELLELQGQLDNTLIFFMADNGGCSEWFPPTMPPGPNPIRRDKTRDGRDVHAGNNPEIFPGPEDTWQSYGVGWANLSNTPFRLYKHWTHEGGIATPLIVHWPAGIAGKSELRPQRGYLPDVMATVVEATGAAYPREHHGQEIPPCEGVSLVPAFAGQAMADRMMFWEHEGNAAVREGKWKLVKNFAAIPTGERFEGEERGDWELYDTDADRTEMCNLASANPKVVARMKAAWEEWANRCSVIPRENWLASRAKSRGKSG